MKYGRVEVVPNKSFIQFSYLNFLYIYIQGQDKDRHGWLGIEIRRYSKFFKPYCIMALANRIRCIHTIENNRQ